MGVRVGHDLVAVELVRDALAAHGEHYLRRVYTAREIEDCSGAGAPAPERLAARFAAKEATLKLLRAEGIPMTAIEVRRDPGGWVELELHGAAAATAAAAGLRSFSLSLTHEGDYAAAVAVALTEDP